MTDDKDSRPDERVREALREINDYESLVVHPGWIRLSKTFWEGMDFDLSPLSSLDDVPRQEHRKGEILGVKKVLQHPQVAIEASKELVKAFTPPEEETESDD